MSYTSKLGTSASTLGNIVLGFGAPSTNSPAENTLTLSQSVSHQKVVSVSVSNTITFTESTFISHPVSASNTLTLTQSVLLSITQPASNTLTLTQLATYLRVTNLSTSSTLNLTQINGRTTTINRSVNHTITLSQSTINVLAKYAINTLSFSQTASAVLVKKATNHIDLTQVISATFNLNKAIGSYWQYYQTLSTTKTLNISVSNTLTLTQLISRTAAKAGINALSLVQTVSYTVSRAAKNILNFVQSVVVQKTSNVRTSSRLRYTQSATDLIHSNKKASNALGYNQTVKAWKVFNVAVTNTLNLTQEEVRERFDRTINQELSLSQDVDKLKISQRQINQTLNLSHSVVHSNVLNRSAGNTLVYLPNHIVYMPVGNVGYVPVENLIFTQTRRSICCGSPPSPTYGIGQLPKSQNPYCILQVPERAITLPAAEFNDVENYGGIFIIRRTMKGGTVTYTHKLDTGKVKYDFVLGNQKRLELVDYLRNFNSRIHRLTNWKGEIWHVFVTTNPLDFISKSRYSNGLNNSSDNVEKVIITMEFEGTRVH